MQLFNLRGNGVVAEALLNVALSPRSATACHSLLSFSAIEPRTFTCRLTLPSTTESNLTYTSITSSHKPAIKSRRRYGLLPPILHTQHSPTNQKQLIDTTGRQRSVNVNINVVGGRIRRNFHITTATIIILYTYTRRTSLMVRL